MATKAPAKREEKLFECEVKRRRTKVGATGYEFFWKTKSVKEALVDGDTEFRCKDCHGPVKLFKRHVADGPPPHAEHKLRGDSEYCPSGMYFRQSDDGREPRVSEYAVK